MTMNDFFNDIKDTEARLVQQCKKNGYETLKLAAKVGIPDRIILIGHGEIVFVMIKTQYEQIRKAQRYEITKLYAAGYDTFIIRNYHDVDILMSQINEYNKIVMNEENENHN